MSRCWESRRGRCQKVHARDLSVDYDLLIPWMGDKLLGGFRTEEIMDGLPISLSTSLA
jgi:hypothetical protein